MRYTIDEMLGIPLNNYLEKTLEEPLKMRYDIWEKQKESVTRKDKLATSAYADLHDITESIALEDSLRTYWEKGANIAEKHPNPTLMAGIGGATLLTLLLGPIGLAIGIFGVIGGYEMLKDGKGARQRGIEKYTQKIAKFEKKYSDMAERLDQNQNEIHPDLQSMAGATEVS